MRSKSKGPKHASASPSAISILSDKSRELKSKIHIRSGYTPYICGIAVLTVTTVLSLNFAFGSQWSSAVNNAYEAIDSDLIYDGIFIEEVNISNLTREQAIRRGNDLYAAPRLSRGFTIAFGDYSKDITFADLGGSYDIEKTVAEAYALGRSGSKEKRIASMEQLSNNKEFLVSSLEIDQGKLKTTIKDIAKEIEELYPENGKVDTDFLIEDIEKNMRIGESDMTYNVSFK